MAQLKLRTNIVAIPMAIFRNWRCNLKNCICEAGSWKLSLPGTVVSSFHDDTSGTGTHLPLLSDAVCNSAERASSRDTDVPHKYKCGVLSYTTGQPVRCEPFAQSHGHSLQSAQSSAILRRCLVRASDHFPSRSRPNRATIAHVPPPPSLANSGVAVPSGVSRQSFS